MGRGFGYCLGRVGEMVIGLKCVFGWKIRESVGVKIEVLNFGATMFVLQEFEALCLKKRFTESLKVLQDNVFGVNMKNWLLTSRRLKWYFYFRFTELNLENQIQQGSWSGCRN